jgi:hypothetical protein
MNLALQTPWMWPSRVDASRPTYLIVGDGSSTFFMSGMWLLSGCIKDFALTLFPKVPEKASRLHLVKDGLAGDGWMKFLKEICPRGK